LLLYLQVPTLLRVVLGLLASVCSLVLLLVAWLVSLSR
jgi:hypothetical protein